MNHKIGFAWRTKWLLFSGLWLAVVASAQQPYGGMAREQRAYPTGDPQTSVILIERVMPRELRVGSGCDYQLTLTNLTNVDVNDVMLVEQFPAGFSFAGAQPQPTRMDGGRAVWQIGKLGPREARQIRIGGGTSGMSELTFCATVTYTTGICSTVRIVNPALVLEKSLPPAAMICDAIPMRLVVRNTGSGTAQGVQILDNLPEGLATTDGKRELAFSIGDLAPGQAREVTATLRASRTGQFVNTARAIETGGLSADASASVRVTQPVLELVKSGPATRYLGRSASFDITVRNSGDAPANNAVLVDTIPDGLRFETADNGGRASGNSVTWNLGTLEPGASRTVSTTMMPTRAGRYQNTATVNAYCAEARGSAVLEVLGIPAVLLEVVDVDDPIEVGSNEVYLVRVLNQGTADGTNIRVTCTLPPELDYVLAEGPTRGVVSGKTITYEPLPVLAPKATATYRITAKGLAVGDVRFKVSLVSDQTSSPVEETESTHVY